MNGCKRGDERIVRVTEVDGERTSWVCEGELVRCRDCVNWNTMVPDGLDDYEEDRWCPVVRRCTFPGEWCCWGARKGSDQ